MMPECRTVRIHAHVTLDERNAADLGTKYLPGTHRIERDRRAGLRGCASAKLLRLGPLDIHTVAGRPQPQRARACGARRSDLARKAGSGRRESGGEESVRDQGEGRKQYDA